jgi:enoyl-CoA hydratase/carnithine racemase
MAYDEIVYELADRVATITLNRPAKLNAWTPKMEQEVQAALLQADADDEARVIVITGAGRGFCAGADMKNLDSLAGAEAPTEKLRQMLGEHLTGPRREGARQDFQKTYSYLPAVSKPIVAAVNGAAAGLGLVIAMYCDLRIASDQARFSTAFARRGLIAEHGIAWMLPRLVGLANALDLLFSARLIDAAEAQRMGLVNRVVPQGEFAAEVQRYAVELASLSSPRSLRIVKRQVYNALFQTLGEAIDAANEEMLKSFSSADFREGVAHFVEKRPPAFTGQ